MRWELLAKEAALSAAGQQLADAEQTAARAAAAQAVSVAPLRLWWSSCGRRCFARIVDLVDGLCLRLPYVILVNVSGR